MKNFSIKKVYTIMIIAILIIAISVSLSFEQSQKNIIDIGYTEGIEDIESSIDSEDPNQQDEGIDTSATNQTVPTFSAREGFKCYTYAIDLLNSCKGFEIEKNTIGQAVGESQYVKEKLIISQQYYYKENLAYTTMPSLGKTFFRYFYSSDGGNTTEYKMTNKLNSDNTPNWSGLCENSILDKNGVYYIDGTAFSSFAILPSSKQEMISFDRSAGNSKYYVIKFQISNISQEYIENIRKEGDLEWVNVSKINFTFYIEKATMYLKKVEKSEAYKGKKIIEFDCVTKQTSYIKQIDKVIVPTKPQI